MQSLSFDPRLSSGPLLEAKALAADRLLKAWSWKSALGPSFPVIVCLMGGTGTGKSTLFNSLAGKVISPVGLRRPFTVKPRILAPEEAVPELLKCPFLDGADGSDSLIEDAIQAHQDEALAGVILVDTPDFDSVELAHHLIADNFFLISDVILFVTSQEKYADLASHEAGDRALAWGKRSVFVMNKTTSDVAFSDFRKTLQDQGRSLEPLQVERVDSAPSMIPDLRLRSDFGTILTSGFSGESAESTRENELSRLRANAAAALEELLAEIDGELDRVDSARNQIFRLRDAASREMDRRLDAVISQDVEGRMRERLQQLLRKYDFLFTPRMMIRNFLKRAWATGAAILGGNYGAALAPDDERSIRFQDLKEARDAVRLEPLDAAVARLNSGVADLLCSDSKTDDLCRIVRTDAERWDRQKIRKRYDEAFPGVEQLLETEFQKLKDGLSSADEMKLYGSYTLWALLLITVEITVLGGSALLDALLSSVILPFIPKWVLNLKVVDLLKQIALRVEEEHRATLRDILNNQAKLHSDALRRSLPDDKALAKLRSRIAQLKGHEDVRAQSPA